MYELKYTEGFFKKIEKWNRKNKKSVEIIEKRINKNTFKSNPRKNSIHLIEPRLKGKRRIKLANDLRVIYALCDECVEMNHMPYNGCAFCNGEPNKWIILFDFDFRGGAYK